MLQLHLLPWLFIFFCVARGAAVVERAETFEHTDPASGQILICDKCPPGTYMAAPCEPSRPTRCAPCRSEHFTELWNYLPRCLYCDTFCTGNQEVATECSSTNNRVCRCKAGFFLVNDFCFKHSECAPGHGVLHPGTTETDTVCERCPEGFFSNSSSVCVRHQVCAQAQQLLAASSLHDTVCGTCADLANGGEKLREFLSAFFYDMRVQKMKKLVNRLMRPGQQRSTGNRAHLQSQITEWLRGASEQQLTNMESSLRASQLQDIAERLHRKMEEIQQGQDCILTAV